MIECSGWWQQNGYGRQWMNDLRLDFRGPTIYGEGKDIIASFTLSGKVRQTVASNFSSNIAIVIACCTLAPTMAKVHSAANGISLAIKAIGRFA